MITPSPVFKINGGAAGAKASVAAGGSVTCVLDSTDGVNTVEWSIVSTDHQTDYTDWDTNWTQSGSVGQQLDFDAPVMTGVAVIIQCQINSGVDPKSGDPSSTMRATAKVYVNTTAGLEVLTAGELAETSVESNATHGAIEPINEAILAVGGSGIGPWKEPARAATTGALPANTRSNNTLTASANGALPAQDGVTLSNGQVLLVKDEGGGASHPHNGPYIIDDIGSAGTPWEMTRAPASDENSEIYDGMVVRVGEGTLYADHMFVQKTNIPITVNTTYLEFIDQGNVGALVDIANPGSVNSLGAANTVLMTDGATPGGGWAKLGTSNFTPGSNSTVLQTNAGGSVVWAALPATSLSPGADNTVMQTTSGAAAWEANLSLGATPSTTGRVRLTSGDGIYRRNVGNSADVGLIRHDGAATQYTGAASTDITGHYVQAGSAGFVALMPGTASVKAYSSYLELLPSGGTPAGQGSLRVPDDWALVFASATSGDIGGLWLDGVNDDLTFGGVYGTTARPRYVNVDATTGVNFMRGGNSRAVLTDTDFTLNGAVGVVFGNGNSNPRVVQNTRVGADAYDMTIQAQGAPAGFDGGDLILAGGAAVDGSGNWGQVLLKDGGGTARVTVEADGDVVINANASTYIKSGGNNKLSVWGSTTELGNATLQFDDALGNVTITHGQDTAGAGSDLTIQAQQGAAGDNDGGDLKLYGGLNTGTGILGEAYMALADDSAYVRCYQSGGNKFVIMQAATSMGFNQGGTQRMSIGSQISLNGHLYFAYTTSSPPEIYHSTELATTSSQSLTVRAQDNSVTDGTAGNLILKPGEKTGSGTGTDGALYIQDGGGTARVTIEADGDVVINGAANTALQVGGSNSILLTAGVVWLGRNQLSFDASRTSPIFLQQSIAGTGSLVGQTLLIHSQDISGPSGTDTGGDLALRPGSGVTSGDLLLQDGTGATQLTVNESGVTFAGGIAATFFDASSYVEIGATPALTGGLRLTNSTYIKSRYSSVDVDMMYVSSAGNLIIGDSVNAVSSNVYAKSSGSINWYIGGSTNVLYATSTIVKMTQGRLDIGSSTATGGNVNLPDTCSIRKWSDGPSEAVLLSATSSDDITLGGTKSNAITIQSAQASTGVGHGSDVLIVGQQGESGAYDGGDAILQGGADGGSGADGSAILKDGTGNDTLTVGSNTVELTLRYLQWDVGEGACNILQEASGAADHTGYTLTMQAQNVTGSGTIIVGGHLYLKGGDAHTGTATGRYGGAVGISSGRGAGTGVDGSVTIQTGTTNRLVFESGSGDVLFNPTNDYTFNIGGSQEMFLSASKLEINPATVELDAGAATTIKMATDAVGSIYALTLQGMDSSSAAAGGSVYIDPGQGTSQSGVVYIRSNTTNRIIAGNTGIGFFGKGENAQPSTTGTIAGFTKNASSNEVYDASTFDGNLGGSAYTIGDIVKALIDLGLLAS